MNPAIPMHFESLPLKARQFGKPFQMFVHGWNAHEFHQIENTLYIRVQVTEIQVCAAVGPDGDNWKGFGATPLEALADLLKALQEAEKVIFNAPENAPVRQTAKFKIAEAYRDTTLPEKQKAARAKQKPKPMIIRPGNGDRIAFGNPGLKLHKP